MLKQRPVYLDLVRIRLPLPGIVSILHRASGALLFLLGIPLLLAAFAASLKQTTQHWHTDYAFKHAISMPDDGRVYESHVD